MDAKKAEKAILKKLQSRLKLVIVGDGCVGKTSLLFAYGAKQFLQNHEPTVFENYVTTVELSNKKEVSRWISTSSLHSI
jgi:GTPase SAR1 family protein